MMDDTHEQDQQQARAREFATTLARDVAMYRTTLKNQGVSDDLADDLTREFQAHWLTTHLDSQAMDGGIMINLMSEDDDV